MAKEMPTNLKRKIEHSSSPVSDELMSPREGKSKKGLTLMKIHYWPALFEQREEDPLRVTWFMTLNRYEQHLKLIFVGLETHLIRGRMSTLTRQSNRRLLDDDWTSSVGSFRMQAAVVANFLSWSVIAGSKTSLCTCPVTAMLRIQRFFSRYLFPKSSRGKAERNWWIRKRINKSKHYMPSWAIR